MIVERGARDQAVHEAIAEALQRDARIMALDLGYTVYDAVVTLSGWVSSYPQRMAVERTVEGVRDVRSIVNNILVRLPIDQRRTDVEIAHDVVDALLAEPDVPENTVKARVQDRWVWIVGEAMTPHERAAAERAVEKVPGIKGITNLVRIKTPSRPMSSGRDGAPR